MVFACQQNSFLKEFTTCVVSCKEADLKTMVDGKVQKVNGYEVILKDTVLFPEGGGQPDDRGWISEKPVLRITRRGADAIHFLTSPLDVGAEVNMIVDWKRRFDHMQQHSGQHLLTAVIDNMYGYKTTSWNLGSKVSFVELDTSSLTSEQFEEIERVCNEKIREGLPVTVNVYAEGSDALKEVRSRGLPEDQVGDVRVVVIEGVDENMCCGTHVSNLAQLQAIKLLYSEKGKKGKINLHFLVGDRVLSKIGETIQKERLFTEYLKGGPDQHVELVEKIQKALKVSQKNETNLIRDLAVLEAERFKAIQPRPCIFSLHRKEGNVDFMSIIVNEIGDQDVLIFLTIGDDKGAGQMLLSGRPEVIAELGPKVMDILDGKGAIKGTRFNGKVKNLNQRSKAEKLLREAVEIRKS